MGEQINKIDLSSQMRVLELELGEVLAHRNIPFRLALCDELTHSNSRESFGHGTNLRDCLKSDIKE
jgi:hypothetical protein